MPDFSPLTNWRDIQELKERTKRLEGIVEAFQQDLADPNEGEAPLRIPPIPRTLKELGLAGPSEEETTDRDTGG